MTIKWRVHYPGIAADYYCDFDTLPEAQAFAAQRIDAIVHSPHHVYNSWRCVNIESVKAED